MNLKSKRVSGKSLKINEVENKNKGQNIFLLSVFPKESTFSMKESDVPIYFIILDVSDEKKCPGKKRNDKKHTFQRDIF